MSRRYIIGAIVVAIAVVAALVGVTLAGGDDEGGEAVAGAAEARELVSGIPQEGMSIGRPGAPVTVVEYGDTSCPACRQAAETVVPELIGGPVREGTARLEFRPVAFVHPDSSERGALGALAAGEQDAAWTLIDLIYRNQGNEARDWLTDDVLASLVEAAGLDVEAWRSAYRGDAVAAAFFESASRAEGDRIAATPTFVVAGPRGERTLEGVAALAEIRAAIREVAPAGG